MTQQSLRERIAVVPQEVELFSRSIRENIAYGKDELTDDEVERAASTAQAHGFIEKCDEGYDTQVGERGMKLSGGERQRLGIARAIVRDPEILILDEATSHLDGESERAIQLAMERVTRGRTSFIIAHRLSTVRNADLVVVVANNTVEAVGTHNELWSSSPTYRKLHSIHFAEKPKGELREDLCWSLPDCGKRIACVSRRSRSRTGSAGDNSRKRCRNTDPRYCCELPTR